MDNGWVILGAISAALAAVAAWWLCFITKDSLNFNKALIHNKIEINHIDNILEKLNELKVLIKIEFLDQSDTEFERYDFLSSNIKELLVSLSSHDAFKDDISQLLREINGKEKIYEVVKNNPSYLDDKLKKLKNSLLS